MSKILVVDDSPTEIFQFKEMLEKMGHEVITAENGRAGVEMAVKEQPDVVLMDIVMPDMNGFQATRQIARGESTKHIPVIIVSSKNQETDKVWGQRQGAKGYITKPVNPQELVSVMQACM
ncbi:MAG: response regulator [Pseudomonadales bacterium]|nr:response regulator [Pseudomonadales bacterium]MBO6564853.1 response regulator [Pseudomonadales bacterium]MBO6596706.1 response regulator [Pseudomonadales bacterium]MBO6656007.1 response regulator [Pseudomonadales bacterium]MBO6703377.1 response regulator [Pseudomonadales bacterium]